MRVAEILEAIPKLSALVVGDICLDRWCTYDPAAGDISRETGISRIGVVKTQVTPGAAGTVANNLAAIGCGRVAVLGAIGNDGFGFELEDALRERGIDSSLCVRAAGFQTFTYTKLINCRTGEEDLPRVDFINNTPFDAAVEREIAHLLHEAAGHFDAVIVSDQAETSQGGVVTAAIRGLVAELATAKPEQIFLADSRARVDEFRDVIIKPNQQEGEAACRKLFGRVDYPALRRYARARVVMVTHGAEGVLVASEAGERWVQTRRVAQPVDICGAGDSFSAGAALAMAAGASPEEAAAFGNLIASITIMKKGTGVATPEEVRSAVSGSNLDHGLA
jgi:rfaE bifunctional protein kinase chain/domain